MLTRSIARSLWLSLAGLLFAAAAHAVFSIVPPGFTQETVVSGLPKATQVAFAPDGRLFIALKSGRVRVLTASGTLLAQNFIDLSNITCDCTDRGLLGIAVDPQFPARPYIYLSFTLDPPGVPIQNDSVGGRVSQVIRVQADPATGFNVALPGMALPRTTPGGPGHWVMVGTNSTLANIGDVNVGRNTAAASCMVGLTMAGAPIEDCIPADENSHATGALHFAADGSLFISSGDGSNYSNADPRALRAQMLDSLAGKILRIDPNTGHGLPDNPFFDPANPNSNRSKIWAYGLRNPFRFAIDEMRGDIHIGDVSWGRWDEINRGKGANFGWPCYEGGAPGLWEGWQTTSIRQPSYEASPLTSAQCAAVYAQGLGAVTPAEFAWDHESDDLYPSVGGASAGMAHVVYPGGAYPIQYVGSLFISDYVRLWIRVLHFDANGNVASVSSFAKESTNGITQVLRGPDSNLYALVYASSNSRLDRFRYTSGGNTPPTAVATATPTSGMLPLAVSFNGQTSFDPDTQPLTYTWDFGDGASGSGATASHTYTTAGIYTVTLTVTEQTAPFATGTASLVVTAGVVAPIATVSSPAPGTTFALEDVINFSGSASVGGVPLPASALQWELVEHHNVHTHAADLGTGTSGSFEIHDHADGVWYEVCLTATDRSLSDTQCVALNPRTIDVTVESNPTGAQIVYVEDGLILPTPILLQPTEGSTRTLVAPSIHQWRSFDRWSDGVATPSRQFTTGTAPLAFEALFVNGAPSASFSATAGAGATRAIFDFDAGASADPEGGALLYAWSLGDGASANGATAQHAYAIAGTFDVTLAVTDPAGGTATTTTQVTLTNAAPTAAFIATPTSGDAPLAVSFDASGSSDSDGDALAHAWNFGDGASASGAIAAHTFAAPGVYTTTLGVSDALLATSTEQVVITVTGNQPPNAVANASVPSGAGRLTVSFDGASSSDADGTIASYAWDFGDGASGSGAQVAHAYVAPGAYSATLTVTDGAGATDSAAVSVSIPNSAPSAAFSATATAGIAPLLASFDASASSDDDGDALAFGWDFGDGATASGAIVSHTYAAPGAFTVTLAVTDPFLATSTQQTLVTANPPRPPNSAPSVDAGADSAVFAPNAAALDASVSDDGQPSGSLSASWSVDSGPGAVSFADANAIDTTATFSAPGAYVLRLTVSDGALQASDTVSVASYGVVSFSRTITNKADDAEQLPSGAVDLSSSDLELVFDAGGNQTVGLRFPSVTIPAGAPIASAYVQFEVDEVSTGAAALVVSGEKSASAAAFTTAAGSLGARPRTTATAPWTPPAWPTLQVAGVDQRTPNLAAIVQEIVSQPGWTSGNALALLVTGTGKRTAESANGTRAPVLVVQYGTLAQMPNAAPAVNAGLDQTIALGTSATLGGVVTDDGLPSPPAATSSSWSLVSGPGSVTFSAPTSAATGASFSAAGSYVLRLTASDSALSASDDVTVTVTPPGLTTFTRGAAKPDDAEELASGTVDTTSSDLELVFDAGGNQTVGLRFIGITVPASATIVNAYVQFEVDEVSTGACALTITGERVANSSAFATTPFSISNRPRTSASVPWSPAPWPTIQVAGVDQRTPNLAAIVQEIISQPGWASGNALTLLLNGSGKRTAESGNGTRAPVLVIEYQ